MDIDNCEMAIMHDNVKLENGKIENKGNHEHLMEHSAVYKKLQLQEKSNEN